MNRDKILEEDFNNFVLNKAKTLEVFNESTKQYWIDFPEDINSNENEEDKLLPTSNTSLYDHDSEG